MDIRNDVKPYAVTYSEDFDYDVRAVATRILDQGCTMGRVGAAEVLAHPKALDILLCLSRMALGGFVDYYRGDDEAARWAIAREYGIAWDLAHIEQQIETSERTTELNLKVKAELAQREAEIRNAWEAGTPPPQTRRQKLPPGTPVSYATMRAVAIMRQRDAAEE